MAELSLDARDAERTIPRAVLITLGTAVVLYLLVGGDRAGDGGRGRLCPHDA